MSKTRAIGALIPIIAFAASGFASAATHFDGKIPVYPNAVPRGFGWNDPKTPVFLKAGIPIYTDSTDSVVAVSTWYEQHLPKSCGKTTQSVGIHFECSIGVVNVLPKNGKTLIVISPT